jgi:AP-4 complex subunit beta-1
MGLLKVFHFNNSLISEKDVETLYEMIKDTDSLVVHNTLLVLNEILKKDDGGIAINSKMIIYLLNRIRDFNDWGQSTILELVSRFTPKDETQLYDILNILEDRLKHSSSSIVLGCIKIFLNFTKDNNKIYNQVLQRLKDPLITLISSGEISGNHELSYVILTHIHIILLK